MKLFNILSLLTFCLVGVHSYKFKITKNSLKIAKPLNLSPESYYYYNSDYSIETIRESANLNNLNLKKVLNKNMKSTLAILFITTYVALFYTYIETKFKSIKSSEWALIAFY